MWEKRAFGVAAMHGRSRGRSGGEILKEDHRRLAVPHTSSPALAFSSTLLQRFNLLFNDLLLDRLMSKTSQASAGYNYTMHLHTHPCSSCTYNVYFPPLRYHQLSKLVVKAIHMAAPADLPRQNQQILSLLFLNTVVCLYFSNCLPLPCL